MHGESGLRILTLNGGCRNEPERPVSGPHRVEGLVEAEVARVLNRPPRRSHDRIFRYPRLGVPIGHKRQDP